MFGLPNFFTRLDFKPGGNPMAQLNMRQMKKGQSGIIRRVSADGELGRRIRDMGLVPGTPVHIQGRAPLKDPVALRVMGFTLALRNHEADYIQVEVD
jgi:ferrous iron transport protein A